MLPGPGLGDDAFFAHPHREQRLPHAVVDFMGPGVVEVFPLQINPRPAAVLGQPLGKIQRAGPAHVVLEQVRQVGLEGFVGLGLFVLLRQFFQGVHQRFGHESPAEFPKPPRRIGNLAAGLVGLPETAEADEAFMGGSSFGIARKGI